jgi:hypothetical protein
MSPIGTPVAGAFPLTTVEKLPNVTIAYPGERWSDRKCASAAITPGEAIVPIASGGAGLWRRAYAGDAVTQLAVASRTIDVPDQNPGSQYAEALGPNEIRNLPIPAGDYVLAIYSGALILSLVEPAAYVPGDLIGWKPSGARPTGKAGTGSWAKQGAGVIGPVFEVQTWRAVNSSNEGLLNVRSLRGQGPF